MTTRKSFGLAAAAVTAFALLAAVPAYAGPPTDRPDPGTGPRATAMATAPLSDAEKTDIAFMRDEERLAKELYETFDEKWDVRQFERIAKSEQRHFDAMGRVISRYQLPDPSAGAEVGKYADPALQELWDDWYQRGMESKEAAIAVGIELEKADISDLQEAIETSDNADLDRVYGNLLKGSENHLRAFEAAARGETVGLGQGQGRMDQGQGRMGQGRGRMGQGNGAGAQQGPMDRENCPNR
ncbi:DUF2202 domain-containing protein [Granulicoccus sp. GXG6511]|uniref:DUF2202 domain-containing protein n=1 Tax=Granulicoccus sp. GXG6511 TaxID=3381351 RepID=UPI003D7C5019